MGHGMSLLITVPLALGCAGSSHPSTIADPGADADAAAPEVSADVGAQFDGPVPSDAAAPVFAPPARLDSNSGAMPSVHFAPDRTLLAHYNDAEGDAGGVRRLFQRVVAPGGVVASAAAPIATEEYRTAIRFEDAQWEMAASTKSGYDFLLSADHGATWKSHQTVSSTDGNCAYLQRGHVRFATGPDGPLVAIEYFHDSHIFGCSNQSWLGHAGSVWLWAPTRAGNGTPADLFADATSLVIITDAGSLASADHGATFVENGGGGTTDARLGGTGAVHDSAGNEFVVRTYDWASQYRLDLLTGRAAGTNPTRTTLAVNDHIIEGALVALDGDRVVVAFLAASTGAIIESHYKVDAFVMTSPDRGVTWTAPVKVNDTPSDGNVIDLALDAAGGRIAVAWGETLHNDVWGFTGVSLTLSQ